MFFVSLFVYLVLRLFVCLLICLFVLLCVCVGFICAALIIRTYLTTWGWLGTRRLRAHAPARCEVTTWGWLGSRRLRAHAPARCEGAKEVQGGATWNGLRVLTMASWRGGHRVWKKCGMHTRQPAAPREDALHQSSWLRREGT